MSSTPPRPATVSGTGLGWRHPHYAELLERQPALAFLEVHSENFFADGGAALAVLERGRQDYPISLHGVGLSLGSALGLDDWHLDQLDRLVRRIDPIRVSDHACFARAHWRGAPHHAADLLPLPHTREAQDVMVRNIERAQERLRRPLALENLSAYLHWQSPADDSQDEADWLVGIARRTGCQLLVDVNNLYVNARNAQLRGAAIAPLAACRAWIDRVPANLVAEIHLAGHQHVHDAHGEIVVDDHGSRVCPEVWQLHAHALQRWGARPTLIEWDTDIPALDVLLTEVAQAENQARALTPTEALA